MPKRLLPKPKIFISHSAHEARTKTVLNGLIKCLKRDFDVLVDKQRLKPGQDFRDEIFRWINRAHGAVVLFSSSALSSDWVRTEASLLAARRTLDKDKSFTLIPVLLNPVTKTDLERKEFSPMHFPLLHLVSSNNLQVICKKVREGLGVLRRSKPPATPMEILIQKVGEILKRVNAEELLNAANAMDVDIEEWTDSSEYPILLAEQMLEQGLLSAGKAIRVLDDFLDAAETNRLIELIAPVWVSLRAASAIPLIATSKDQLNRRLWVNGGDEQPAFTAGHFIRRACARPPDTCWPVLPVPPDGGEDEVGYYIRVIRESLKNKVLRQEDANDSTVNKVLAYRDDAQEPVFVAFYPPGPAPETLAALRREFPTLTFFILTGNQTVLSHFPPDVEFLEPKLQAGEEARAYAQYITVRSYRLNS